VAVHYDTRVLTVTDSQNQVECQLYDSSNQNGCLQYSYIFDGVGSNEKTQLFYFYYQINENAPLGNTCFDIVVSDAYTAELNSVDIRGSRCNISVSEATVMKSCYAYGTDRVSTSVKEEFEISYFLSDCQLASGAMVLSYNPELFELVELTKGGFLANKLVDVNTSMSGAVYLSFLSTEYGYDTDLLKVKFRTVRNVDADEAISLTVQELYDLDLNQIQGNGHATSIAVSYDEAYTEDSPAVLLSSAYSAETGKVTVAVRLEANSRLGAGDFVLKFDPEKLTYVSGEKGFAPTFFNLNEKNVEGGVLKFSIISMTDLTDALTLLTVTLDAKPSCADEIAAFEISGSGLTDSLTNGILLNFVDSDIIVPPRHIPADAGAENEIGATCTENGHYDSVVYCSVCKAEISREEKSIDKLGHDYKTEWTVDVAPTCTEKGSQSHHCVRCDAKTDVTELPANGHSFGDWYETKAPTCTATGTDGRECAVCHAKETRVTNAKGHTNATAVIENKVDATCTENGHYDSVVYCSVCKAEISREEKSIDKLGHDYKTEWTVDVAPTCTEKGSQSHHCARCDTKTDVTDVDALGHTFGEWFMQDETQHKRVCACGEAELSDHTFDNEADASCNICGATRDVAAETSVEATGSGDPGANTEKSGCGSVVSSGWVLIILMMGAGYAALRKRMI